MFKYDKVFSTLLLALASVLLWDPSVNHHFSVLNINQTMSPIIHDQGPICINNVYVQNTLICHFRHINWYLCQKNVRQERAYFMHTSGQVYKEIAVGAKEEI